MWSQSNAIWKTHSQKAHPLISVHILEVFFKHILGISSTLTQNSRRVFSTQEYEKCIVAPPQARQREEAVAQRLICLFSSVCNRQWSRALKGHAGQVGSPQWAHRDSAMGLGCIWEANEQHAQNLFPSHFFKQLLRATDNKSFQVSFRIICSYFSRTEVDSLHRERLLLIHSYWGPMSNLCCSSLSSRKEKRARQHKKTTLKADHIWRNPNETLTQT